VCGLAFVGDGNWEKQRIPGNYLNVVFVFVQERKWELDSRRLLIEIWTIAFVLEQKGNWMLGCH
jgi:hypothetical protein